MHEGQVGREVGGTTCDRWTGGAGGLRRNTGYRKETADVAPSSDGSTGQAEQDNNKFHCIIRNKVIPSTISEYSSLQHIFSRNSKILILRPNSTIQSGSTDQESVNFRIYGANNNAKFVDVSI